MAAKYGNYLVDKQLESQQIIFMLGAKDDDTGVFCG
jgi:hypothetical protein